MNTFNFIVNHFQFHTYHAKNIREIQRPYSFISDIHPGNTTLRLFSPIAFGLNVHIVVFGHVRQPFQGDVGLFRHRVVSVWWYEGNGVLFEEIRAIDQITRRRNGDAFLKRIDGSDATKQITKFHTTTTKNVHVGTTVFDNLLLKIEYVSGHNAIPKTFLSRSDSFHLVDNTSHPV